MFENVRYQSASSLLEKDLLADVLPGSILFAGPAASGKLSAALELARILSCHNGGEWECKCPSCLRHKALVSTSVLLAGSGDRTLEIRAAKKVLLTQSISNSSHVEAAQYLYVRAVRKLTSRFNQILWEGDDKLSKFSPLLSSINENLEILNPGRVLPDQDELEKILDSVGKNCDKLENTFLYDSIPVSQIRNISTWAHMTSESGKKVLILENAESMGDSARNALLKILEEPPENVVFILLTSKRNAILPTILSRVRTYNFFERTKQQQQLLISKIFYYSNTIRSGIPETIKDFLMSYLDVPPETVKEYASLYFKSVAQGHVPNMNAIVSGCNGFQPRVLFNIFLDGIISAQKVLLLSGAGAECSAKIVEEIRTISNNVNILNESPVSALEQMARDFMQINHLNNGILKCIAQTQDQ